MKTYSETMKSVLEKAAVITEEKREKAQKTRRALAAASSAVIMLALLVGAALVIKPFGSRGESEKQRQGAENGAEHAAVTPDCMEGNPIEATPEPTPFPGYAYTDILAIAPEDFAFKLRWNVFGISSYDSETGRLVKTTDTTHPEDYVTELFLDESAIDTFYTYILHHIDFFKLPDEYDPINDPASESKVASEPHETIELTVRANGREHTVLCPMVPLGQFNGYCYEAYTFYNMGIRYITGIITNSPEWQALPDYEFLYD